MVADFRIKGRSQIYRTPPAAGAVSTDAHGWRLSIPGDQVVADGATSFVEFSTNAIADTDGYWSSADPDQVRIPPSLGGVYVLGGDLATPSYLAGLILEVVVDAAGDEEDPDIYPIGTGPLVHTRTPRSENALTGFYRVLEDGVVQLKVTNNTGASRTLEQGSFTGVLLLPDGLIPSLDSCQWADPSRTTGPHESCALSVAGANILLINLLAYNFDPTAGSALPIWGVGDWIVRHSEISNQLSHHANFEQRYYLLDRAIPNAGAAMSANLAWTTSSASRSAGAMVALRTEAPFTGPKEVVGTYALYSETTDPVTQVSITPPDPGDFLIAFTGWDTDQPGGVETGPPAFIWPAGWKVLQDLDSAVSGVNGTLNTRYRVATGAEGIVSVQMKHTMALGQLLIVANYGPLLLK